MPNLYDMTFRLSAQLGREFNTTFSAAQKKMSEMQKDVVALNRQQSDVTAYRKQQEAIQKTEQKIADLTAMYNNVQREFEETGSSSSNLQNKMIELNRQIENANLKLGEQTGKLTRSGESLKAAGVDTDKLADEEARLKAESEKLRQEMGDLAEQNAEAAKEAEIFGEKGATAFEVVGNALITAGIITGLGKIYDGYKECVNIAADFQETMSTVEALSGASAEEMSSLGSMAKELGATTKFTATESAEAMTYMAMAGWDAEQMLSGMDGVMQLAAASGEDLAMVSDIVTDNLTAFGLKASDTAHFADILAAAATSSNTSVSIMGETFKNSAALAGALGYSVEDVAVAIGLMANAGIKGSNAGTALKNIFNGLLEGVTLTSEAFGEVEYSAINADGTMKSFGETINDLRGYFAQMTGAEQLHNAEAIAGQRAMSGFVTILNSTQADYDALTESINNCAGSAQKMADIKLNNLNGQVTLMNSAADALKTTIGEAFMPELQALAKVGTEILTDVQQFAEENPTLVKGLILITGEIGALLIAYKSYQTIKGAINTLHALSATLKAKETAATIAQTAAVGAETTATTAATAAQHGLNAAMAANPIGAVIVGVTALTALIIGLTAATKKEVDESEKLTATSRAQYSRIQELNAEYREACELYGETSEEARTLHGELVLLEQDYESSKTTMEEYNNRVEETIESYRSFVDEYNSSIEAIDTESDVTLSLISRLMSLEQQSGKTAIQQSEMSAIVSQLNSRLPDLKLNYDEVTGSLNMTADAIREVVQAEIDQKKYYETVEAKDEAVEHRARLEKELADATEEATAAQAEYNKYAEQTGHSQAGTRQEWWRAILYTMGLLTKEDAAAEKNYRNANARLTEAQKREKELRTEYESADNEVQELLSLMEKYEQALGMSNSETEEAVEMTADLSDALNVVRAGYLDVDKAAVAFGIDPTVLQEAVDSVNEYEENLNAALDAVADGYYTAEEAAKVFGVSAESIEVAGEIENISSALEDLGERYHEIKDAAEQSINGQYDLWDTAAVVITTKIEDINTALETQLSYWSDYNTDLAELLERADDIEGLRDVIASFADGSTDSVNAIAGMAEASDEDLRKMVENWQEVQRQQEEASSAIAELTTGFASELDGMSQELGAAVDGLNLDDEAAEAAQATVDAYVQAIRDGTDDAVYQAQRLASLVAAALQQKELSAYESDGETVDDTEAEQGQSKKYATYGGGANGLQRASRVYTAYASQYAVGTDNASRGVALVGEQGPELVAFDGGETVYTAQETQRILSALRVSTPERYEVMTSGEGGGISIQIAPPHITIQGGQGGEDIETQLRRYADGLVEQVMDALDDAGVDARRREYA